MINKNILTKEFYNPKEVSRYLGISTRTLYNWGTDGLIEFTPIYKEGVVSIRRYSRDAVMAKLKELNLLSLDETRKDVIYARVSTHKQKNRGDLERQINNLKIYASDLNPIDLEVISDVASGLNDNRKGLLKLINLIQEGKINRVFISYKDRLTRFGFNYIKQICDFNNTEIVIVSNDIENKAVELELAEDIISLIHSFSGKLYGLRSKVKLEIDKELSSDEGTTS